MKVITNLFHTIYTHFSKTAILWLSLFVVLALASLFSLPRIQQWRNTYAISNGDVTLGPSATITTATSITSSVANLGTDTAVYNWKKGGNTYINVVNIPFDNGASVSSIVGDTVSGTVNAGATLEADPTNNCKVGSCYNFSGGSTGFIDFGDSQDFQPQEITLETWAYPTGNGSNSDGVYLISKGRAGAQPFTSYRIDYLPSGDIYRCSFAVNGSSTVVSSTSTFAPNSEWTHIACTYDGQDLQIYINGALENTVNAPGVIRYDFTSSDQLYVGKWGFSSFQRAFQGRLDEIKIFNRALSANQILQNCNDGDSDGDCTDGIDSGQGVGGPTQIHFDETNSGESWKLSATAISSTGVIGATIDSTSDVFVTGSQLIPSHISLNTPDESTAIIPTITTPPVGSKVAFQWNQNNTSYHSAYWPFHDSSSTLERDISGNQRNSVGFTASPTYEASGSANCQVGNCYTFNGSQNIQIADFLASNDARTELSVFAWVKANPQTTRAFASQYDISGNGRSWYLGTGASNTDKLRILLTQNGSTSVFKDFYSNTVVWDDTLQHVGFTFNNGDLKLFVNGVEEASPIIARNDAMTTINNSSDLVTIGSFLNNSITGGWTGSVDEVMTFAKALTQDEITQIYNDGVAQNHAPTQLVSSIHAFNETWDISAYEIGSLFGPMNIGSVTIASAPATTVSAVAPVGSSPFSETVTFNYTCSIDAGGSASRDIIVDYSLNGGTDSFANTNGAPTIASTTDGTINGNRMEGITCDGTQKSFSWNTLTSSVALNSTNSQVQIRLTPDVGTNTPGTSANFTVSNPGLVTISADTTLNTGDFNATSVYLVTGSGTDLTINQPTSDPTISIAGLIVQNGATITQTLSTSTQTYKVDLTVSGDVTIESGGAINLDGRGCGNARFDDSLGTCASGGSGGIAGGSHGGEGGLGTIAPDPVYGSIFEPVTNGGGGNTSGFGGTPGVGGGALKIIASSLVLNGDITSDGTEGSASDGAGGSIWIATTNQVSGSGTISVNGGGNGSGNPGGGGGGRIAFYYDSSISGNPTPSTLRSSYSITANGGSHSTSLRVGAPGTIYIEDSNTHTASQGDLVFDTPNIATFSSADGNIPANLNSVTLNNTLLETSSITTTTLSLTGTSILKHELSGATTSSLEITTTDFSISANSSIDVSELGCGNGLRDDLAGNCASAGAGAISGGAYGGEGGLGTGASAPTYGSIQEPAANGAGGNTSGFGGTPGLGGGQVKVTTSNLTLDGSILANGGENTASDGSGGSIWLVTTGSLTGSGTISSNGGGNNTGNLGGGSGGRIAIYYDSSIGGNPLPTALRSLYTITAEGGLNTSTSLRTGAPGTIYIEDSTTHTASQGDLIMDNTNIASNASADPNLPADLNSIIVNNTVLETTSISVTTLELNGSTVLTHPTSGATTSSLELTTTNLTVGSSAAIDVSEKGCGNGLRDDLAGNCSSAGAGSISGGAYGGEGGLGTGASAPTYGSIQEPAANGAGGNTSSFGGVAGLGGGQVKVTTSNLTLDGSILANGGENSASDGSGGSIWLVTTGSLTGSGAISSNGGGGNTGNLGGGGGGRIAIYYDSGIGGNPLPSTLRSQYTISAEGGVNTSTTLRTGAAGTIYLEDTNTQTLLQGDLVIDNNSIVATNAVTPLFTANTTLTVNDLFVINEAVTEIDSPCTGANSLTVLGAIDLSGNGSIVDNTTGTCTISLTTHSINPNLDNGSVNAAYSDQVESPGGYAPKTFECLDGLGGSVVACNAAAGWPTGITMNTSGVVSGTPTVGGTFSPIIRVTDSNPAGGQVVEQTMSLFINSAPNAPTLVSPANTSQVGTTTPTLSAQYSDPDSGDTGTTNYRVSSSSLTDCQGNTNIVDSGTSGSTASNNEPTSYTVSVALSHATTYFWCAQNNDGTNTSGAFTQMGEFTVNLGNAPNEPTLVSPGSGDTTNQVSPLLEVNYSDPDGGDVGTSEFRVSSGSSADCLSNTNVVFTGSSATTTTNNETTSITVGVALTNLATYNWCARNNDGIFTSNSGNFTTMGSFLVDTSFTDGGSLGTIIRSNPGNGGGGGGTDPDPDSTQSDPVQTTIDQFDLTLLITDLNGNTVSDSIDRTSVLFGQIDLFNTNSISASNVFVNLPIPSYVKYVPGSLLVNDGFQSDEADSDIGQGNQNAVSGIWADIPANKGAILSFQLVFDLEALDEFEQAQSAVSPAIQLQASLSADNASQTFFSNTVNLSVQDETESPIVDIPGGDGGPGEDPDGRVLDPTPEPPTDGGAPDNDPNSGDPEQPGGGDSDPDPNGGGDGGTIPGPDPNNPGQPGEGDPGSGGDNDPGPNGGGGDGGNIPGQDPNNPGQPGEGDPGSGGGGNENDPDPNGTGGGDGGPGSGTPTIFVDPIAPPPEIIVDGLRPDPGPMIILMPVSLPDPNSGGGGPGNGGGPNGAPGSGGGLTNPGEGGSSTNPSGGGPNDLVITGTVQSRTTDIELTGTVNAPNAEVTVIINNKSFSGLSDENGLWRAFVSAEEIGVNQGETIRFEVQAFAKKDVRESNRIVSDVILSLTNEGLVAEPVPQVSANVITRTSVALVDVVEENQEEIQTVVAVTAPVVLVTSISLWGYLPYLPTLFFHMLSWLISLFRRKDTKRLYGIAYDAITKQPLPLAIIRIYKEENGKKQLVSTQVTNKEGRYEVLVPEGTYQAIVSKPTYSFPSKLVQSTVDAGYEHVYVPQAGFIVSEADIALPDFPLDPMNTEKVKQQGNVIKRLWLAIQRVGSFLAIPVLFIGLFTSIGMLIIAPENILNWILAFIYLLMLILQLIFRSHPEKPWGVVYDLATNAPLPLTTIQLIDPEFGKVIKSRLADYQGRFSFLPSPGKYLVKASKDGYYQAEVVESRKERIPMKDSISIEKEGDTITGDIGMKQQ